MNRKIVLKCKMDFEGWENIHATLGEEPASCCAVLSTEHLDCVNSQKYLA
jgi:hypothetical protein